MASLDRGNGDMLVWNARRGDLRDTEMEWVFVDPGINNLSFSVHRVKFGSSGSWQWQITHIQHKVDLVALPPIPGEPYPESREMAERIARFVHHFGSGGTVDISAADHVFIERQPPGGFSHVEQLLFKAYRSRASLICPRTVHAFMGFTRATHYEARKMMMVARAHEMVDKHGTDAVQLQWTEWRARGGIRLHDAADTLGMAKWAVYTLLRQLRSALATRAPRLCAAEKVADAGPDDTADVGTSIMARFGYRPKHALVGMPRARRDPIVRSKYFNVEADLEPAASMVID
jgi:hypothetical protein